MERFDIAIIGTGPAGLEAAITSKVRNKNIILFGTDSLSPKIEKAHLVKNYLGLPELSGEKMQDNFKEHLAVMGIDITAERINTVYSMGDYFALQGHSEMYEASSVILATGISMVKTFPGEQENLGRGVSYCATCDASLYRGKQTIVVGYSKKDEEEADFLAEIAAEVLYLPIYDGDISLNKKVKPVRDCKPLSIERNDKRLILKCDSNDFETDGIFILRDSVAPSQLVPGLQLEDNHVAVDRNLRTNIPGLFACGDVTGAPYQYIKAAGEGNVAALSAVNYLAEKSKSMKGE